MKQLRVDGYDFGACTTHHQYALHTFSQHLQKLHIYTQVAC